MITPSRSRQTLIRYVLYQIPGWLIAGALLTVAIAWWNIPGWTAALAFGLWLAKDAALYPFLRRAYEPALPVSEQQMVGLVGIAKATISPAGYVEVRGELWRAELAEPGEPILPGETIRVRGVRGLTLLVVREPARAS